jgi:hypothetical protein
MPLKIDLKENDIRRIEQELAKKAASISPEEKAFLEYLLKLGKAGMQAKTLTEPSAAWEWAYSF